MINFQINKQNKTKQKTETQLGRNALVHGRVYEEAIDSRSETIEDVNEKNELKEPIELIDSEFQMRKKNPKNVEKAKLSDIFVLETEDKRVLKRSNKTL